jgi:hypothetical protein
MRSIRNGLRKTDVRDIADRVEQLSDADNDKGVCCVLHWATRTKAGPTAVVQACSALGLDLHAALVRARSVNRAAGR